MGVLPGVKVRVRKRGILGLYSGSGIRHLEASCYYKSIFQKEVKILWRAEEGRF